MISIIIPTYNEQDHIVNTIHTIRTNGSAKLISEIIVVDGGSSDNTVDSATMAGANVITSAKGRAVQLNEGARRASGSILYFLHADTLPPQYFAEAIYKSITTQDIVSGCFQLQFDLDHWFLNTNAWFTRFDVNAFRFGDQSFYIRKDIFYQIGGFSEKHIVLEDQEILLRARKCGPFKILNTKVTTSARKYVDNGVYKMQGIFYLIYAMYTLGFSQAYLLKVYKSLIRQNKL